MVNQNLLSKFIKAVKPVVQKAEATVNGTVKIQSNDTYVILDGSVGENETPPDECLVPVESTSKVEDGDRVRVTVKDHRAVVTGNTSDEGQAPRAGTVDSGFTNVNSLMRAIASKLYIGNSDVDIRASELATLNSKIDVTKSTVDLNGTVVEAVNSIFDAVDSSVKIVNSNFEVVDDVLKIKGIETESISVNELIAKYANLKTVKADKADILQLLGDSGIFKDLTVQDGTVTGKLVAVEIDADLIKGGTIAADRLVLRGNDGLYYKLNTNNLTDEELEKLTEDEQTAYQDGLHGSAIVANSITADRLQVSDLTAFGATIAGFEMYSEQLDGTDRLSGRLNTFAKESIDSYASGIYIDHEGQFCVGDSKNYIKFKINDGQFDFELLTDGIHIKDHVVEFLRKDGTVSGKWDNTTGYFQSGNLKIDVDERAQFGSFAFMPRGDNSMVFSKVQE